MTNASMRLTDTQFSVLTDALKQFVKAATKVSFANYQCTHDSGRRLGIIRAHDFPREGLTTAASFGLANDTYATFPDRLELVMAWDYPSLDYERLLVVVAETIMIRGRLPEPGVIYRDAAHVAGLPELARRMPHAMVLFPYLWGEAFAQVDLKGSRVWFLQVVPIYDDEKNFIEEHGFETFEELLGNHGAYFEQMQRKSHMEL